MNDKSCNYADIHIVIDAHMHVAPIHTHYILQHITNLVKEITELERAGNQSKVLSKISLDYIPVREEDDPDAIKH